MDRRQLKEIELNEATARMLQIAAQVKELTKEVKEGIATKKDLSNAVTSLQDQSNKVKILQAETKVLSGWEIVQIGEEDLPKTKNNSLVWIIIAIVCSVYLVKY